MKNLLLLSELAVASNNGLPPALPQTVVQGRKGLLGPFIVFPFVFMKTVLKRDRAYKSALSSRKTIYLNNKHCSVAKEYS